jgi:hypothetical protein
MNNLVEMDFEKRGARAGIMTQRQVSAASAAPADDLEQCVMNSGIHSVPTRHGDWLFLPRPWLRFDEGAVLRHETIGDCDGHVCESLCRLQLGGAGTSKVYAKGSISHPDHETIWLPYWHQVVLNAALE